MQSELACIIVCVSQPLLIIFGRGGPCNHSPPVPRRTCIVVRVNHCPGNGGVTMQPLIACVEVRMKHCSHFRRGEAKALIARAYHSSRASWSARWGGNQAIAFRTHESTRALQLARFIAREIEREGGQAIIARARHSSRTSSSAHLGRMARQSYLTCITARGHHSSRTSFLANFMMITNMSI